VRDSKIVQYAGVVLGINVMLVWAETQHLRIDPVPGSLHSDYILVWSEWREGSTRGFYNG
jgi:hypothetical protein